MHAPLRACPTCGHELDEATLKRLGLRVYLWVAKYLPGRVAPTDIDGVLERGGHFLIMEFKSPGVSLPMGQRIMLKRLVKLGMTVIIAWGESSDDDAPVEVGEMDERGDVPTVVTMTAGELGRYVGAWFEAQEDTR